MLSEHCGLLTELKANKGVAVRQAVPAARMTTMAIGGDFAVLLEPNTLAELSAVLSFASEAGITVRFLGAGSNLLVTDAGISDWVVKAGRGFRTVHEYAPGEFEVGCAMSLMSLSRELSQQGYAGLEFAGGIPASLGGAVCMNAGAHGGEMAEVLTAVQVVHASGTVEWISASADMFSYRHTALPAGAMVTAARLVLVASSPEKTAAQRTAFLAHRKSTQPLTQPSSGSVFKNPENYPAAGYLLEQVGVRGHRIGGASISEMHGNWIVNLKKKARFGDVVALIELCQTRVQQRFGLLLQPEIVRWE